MQLNSPRQKLCPLHLTREHAWEIKALLQHGNFLSRCWGDHCCRFNGEQYHFPHKESIMFLKKIFKRSSLNFLKETTYGPPKIIPFPFNFTNNTIRNRSTITKIVWELITYIIYIILYNKINMYIVYDIWFLWANNIIAILRMKKF